MTDQPNQNKPIYVEGEWNKDRPLNEHELYLKQISETAPFIVTLQDGFSITIPVIDVDINLTELK